MNETHAEAILSLKKLNIICVIGTEPHERLKDQSIELDIDIGMKNIKSLKSDHLDDAIDYTAVADLCIHTAEQGKFNLVEALAYAVAQNILRTFEADWVKVKAFKPRPIPHLDGCSVEVFLRKE